ncbi:ParA family protein [Rubellimicrobium roseum]|uniref:ParA family protein n=2 Tax=Rubellimicrobium roseum TaxID=687525 RepID=A0A5C4N6B2_9RHOB|nr:ParA family protein [Rubellimicrobium roseum]
MFIGTWLPTRLLLGKPMEIGHALLKKRHEQECVMSIITVATSKGGAGKTTLAQIITGTVAKRGLRVAAIDADYNHSLTDWVRTFGRYPISVETELNETKIIPLAEKLAETHDLVVIDTAGAAMQATVFAIGCADLVLIPCQLSSADVVEAAKTSQLVQSAAAMTRQEILTRVVLTDYQAKTVVAGHVERELEACGLKILETRLHRLVAFKEMTFTGEVPGEGAAAAQANALLDEVAALGALPLIPIELVS